MEEAVLMSIRLKSFDLHLLMSNLASHRRVEPGSHWASLVYDNRAADLLHKVGKGNVISTIG
ncbi:hypothetical protein ColLi_10957 [Colletotrichum liriopes]|uniref:Uncharacterized protein n=1 Tax=Colletotrichum liriopes TaxID=708192 RepID=A0AA37LXB6_9PEZI|nr:hypothetical protein ColLi_10957 [Colletotrichum liriopes]